ncbi:TPA: transcription elongation factor GreA [Candidatus Falkowbacteria bacterium]|nr:MAG: Transcription elongation factor GreA [Candidatus Falkowbacteria bacterium GW2011_GWF2_43_32]HBA36869.1 transcription elongation factor GreA [Candidatus Falkowbacteria bacterium]
MQVPTRKSEQHNKKSPFDPYLTEEKFALLRNKLKKMQERRPVAAQEVKRLAEMGDFSENAGYQLAKGRLRGLNQRILDLEYQLKNALIIKPNKNTRTIELGHRVTLRSRGQEKTYLILGSTETDPTAGVISHHSPLGQALIGKCVGEIVTVQLPDKELTYKILKIA